MAVGPWIMLFMFLDGIWTSTEAAPGTWTSTEASPGVCQLKSEQGYSGQYVVKWFYDAEKQMCDPFLYEGEGGNGNRFDTQEECKKACDNDHLHSADAIWSYWTSWSTCSVTCGTGVISRSRVCDNSPPARDESNCTGPNEETAECFQEPCPVHSGWSAWNTWSPCSSTCGMGLKHRNRKWLNPSALVDGGQFSGDQTEYDSCTEFNCITGWTQWSGWTSCSSTCGMGSTKRTRSCQNPAASHAINSCSGEAVDLQTCNGVSCVIGWTDWSAWTSCSTTCGTGTQSRNRVCQNPAASALNDSCQGDTLQYQTCTDKSCITGWTQWSRWTSCSSTCGVGSTKRTRSCQNPAASHAINSCSGEAVDLQTCNGVSCVIGWTDWSAWTSCSTTCGTGTQSRNRVCQNPAASALNDSCQGDTLQYRTCTDKSCSTGWTQWSRWTSCSSTCGVGSTKRTRSCQNPAASYAINSCSGEAVDLQTCNGVSCVIGWTDWSAWTSCSTTCWTGTQSRNRVCQNPAASALNDSCQGDALQYRTCSDNTCTTGWTEWSAWSSCTTSCGTGTQSRTRTCQNPLASLLTNSCDGGPLEYRTCTDSSCSSAFLATGVAVVPGTSNLLDIRFPIVALNTGGDYSSTTGVFTCRVPGLYWFTATLMKYWNVDVDVIDCGIRLNGGDKILLYGDTVDDMDGYQVTGSLALQLTRGDRVQVGDCRNADKILNNYYTHFSGMLVRPDV